MQVNSANVPLLVVALVFFTIVGVIIVEHRAHRTRKGASRRSKRAGSALPVYAVVSSTSGGVAGCSASSGGSSCA
jgi:hypothetical protein